MLKHWDRQAPGRLENLFASLQNVAPSHLADRRLFDFAGLGSTQAGAGGAPRNWLVGQDQPCRPDSPPEFSERQDNNALYSLGKPV